MQRYLQTSQKIDIKSRFLRNDGSVAGVCNTSVFHKNLLGGLVAALKHSTDAFPWAVLGAPSGEQRVRVGVLALWRDRHWTDAAAGTLGSPAATQPAPCSCFCSFCSCVPPNRDATWNRG